MISELSGESLIKMLMILSELFFFFKFDVATTGYQLSNSSGVLCDGQSGHALCVFVWSLNVNYSVRVLKL